MRAKSFQTCQNLCDSMDCSLPGSSVHGIEESKLLHFVRFREKSLWKCPDLTPPPVNQSEPLASLGNSSQAQERKTNQNSTPNPSSEGDQSDPETPVFLIFHAIIHYVSNVTQSSGLLPIAAASYRWEPQLELGNKNSLAFASDIGSLVVTGRFHNLGITKEMTTHSFLPGISHGQRSLMSYSPWDCRVEHD